jgi:Zn-finger nucleic acid-binding protein
VHELYKSKYFGEKKLQYPMEFDQCFVCGGLWFDEGELEKYIAKKLRTMNSPSLGADLDARLDVKKAQCPRCRTELTPLPHPHNSAVMMDLCSKCGGVWLDSTEIDKLEKSASTDLFSRVVAFFSQFR